MKKIITLFVFGFSCLILYGQEAVVSSGGYHKSESGSISWGLGELAVETLQSNSFILTQGFQQSTITIVSVYDVDESEIHLNVFPNPTSDMIYLETDISTTLGGNPEVSYTLVDLSGQTLVSGLINEPVKEISFINLRNGIYFLNVRVSDQNIKTFRIIKQ